MVPALLVGGAEALATGTAGWAGFLDSSSGGMSQLSLHLLKSKRIEALARIWSPKAEVPEVSMRWMMSAASSSWLLHDLAKRGASYNDRASRMLSGMLDSTISEKNSAAMLTWARESIRKMWRQWETGGALGRCDWGAGALALKWCGARRWRAAGGLGGWGLGGWWGAGSWAGAGALGVEFGAGAAAATGAGAGAGAGTGAGAGVAGLSLTQARERMAKSKDKAGASLTPGKLANIDNVTAVKERFNKGVCKNQQCKYLHACASR